jgi:hypothetical protein
MKGQFFIISTVIMISAIILITQYLYDYGKADLTKVEQMQELNYIEDIKNSLTSAVHTSCGNQNDNLLLEKDIVLLENQLEKELLDKGITLNIIHSRLGCPNADFTFTMKTSEFYIENSFSV